MRRCVLIPRHEPQRMRPEINSCMRVRGVHERHNGCQREVSGHPCGSQRHVRLEVALEVWKLLLLGLDAELDSWWEGESDCRCWREDGREATSAGCGNDGTEDWVDEGIREDR